MIVLANDGISEMGIQLLKKADITVLEARVSSEHLGKFINDNKVDVLLVRSATQVRQNLIDECPNLKIIGRGGIGMDNIDVEYAIDKGIYIINTPKASCKSVAELVFAHFFFFFLLKQCGFFTSNVSAITMVGIQFKTEF